MAKIINQLSVFLPIYNEKESIEGVVLSTKKVLEEISSEWELILVNDGSTDGTSRVIDELKNYDNRIKVINHKTNEGYGASLKSGLYSSVYPWISFIDSDGQFDFGEVRNLINKQQETKADLVIGYYKKRQVSRFKIITSKIWELSVFVLFNLRVRDIDCGFKLISKRVISNIPRLQSERGAFISSELLIKARKNKFKIVEVPVTHYPRTKGVGTGRNLNVIIQSFIDLGKLWIKLNFG